jgi:transglutaminase-like putative cysteine protease
MNRIKIPHYNTTVEVSSKADVKDIADTMRVVAIEESQKPYVQMLVKQLSVSKNEPSYTAFKLCNFAYKSATFEPDQDGIQVIKTPAALLRSKRGNCVDYTVLLCSIAKAADIPAIIKVVAVGNSDNFGHVYPVINGFPCDVVPYQRQDGLEHLYRSGNEVVYPTEEKYNKFFLTEI